MAGITASKMPFSGLKKLLSEYEIASFPLLFASVTFGKILSLLKIQKPPLLGDSILTFFLLLSIVI